MLLELVGRYPYDRCMEKLSLPFSMFTCCGQPYCYVMVPLVEATVCLVEQILINNYPVHT